MTRTGGLDVAPRDAAIPLADYTASLDAESVPYEQLDGPEIVRRWPQWRLGDEHHGLFQADAGIADPNRSNAAHRRLATAHGATLRDRTPVTAIRDAGGEIEVEARRRDMAGRQRDPRRGRLDERPPRPRSIAGCR